MPNSFKPFADWATAWKHSNSFLKAKFKLTFFYVGIFFLLLNLFVFGLYFLIERNFDRQTSTFESDWQQHVLSYSTKNNIHIIEWQQNPTNFLSKQFFLDFINGFIQNFEKTLFFMEGILLLLAGFCSYFLAGITLAPIKNKMQEQREFLADVSHEIKNPLSALQTTTEVALQNPRWTKKEQQEYLNDFLQEIKRLVKLNSDLLFLEKIETNSEHFAPIDLSIILKNTIERIRNFADKKNISIQAQIPATCLIYGIESELNSLFFNLLHNAVKFTPLHQKIKVQMITANHHVETKIMDTGSGISAKAQTKIFNRFFKEDRARSFEESGAGLGLSIVRKVIKHHQGQIFVENLPNRGTCFTVRFALCS